MKERSEVTLVNACVRRGAVAFISFADICHRLVRAARKPASERRDTPRETETHPHHRDKRERTMRQRRLTETQREREKKVERPRQNTETVRQRERRML